MNSELIYDALNEISDEHIVEAATFEPKAKILPWKKIVAVAACFGVVAVSAFAAVNMDGSLQPTTSDYDSTYPSTTTPTTVAAVIQPTTEISQEPTGTTVAYAPPMEPNTVAGTTMAATTSLKWEQRSYAQCYPDLQFNNSSYTTKQGSLIGEEKLSGLIGTAALSGKDDDGKEHTVNADIYEIKGVKAKCAVALYFKDGAQKQLSAQGYYVYVGKDYIPDSLGTAVEELNFKEHMSFDGMYIYYDAYDVKGYSGLAETRTYYMNEKIEVAFLSLLESSKALQGEAFDYDSTVTAENINLFGRYLGGTIRFSLNSDGYLFFGVQNNSLRYNIGKDAFNSFKNTLEAEGETKNNTAGLVTTTSVTTTQNRCPPLYSSWEEAPIYVTAPSFAFEGKTYGSATLISHAPVFDQNKIKRVLKEDKMLGYTDNYEETLVDVLICEIEGVDKENAVAVGRKDGLQGGYCVYIEKSLYNTDDFSRLLTSLNYKENLIFSEHICMYPQNHGKAEIWIKYYKDDPIAYFKENILDIYVGTTDTIKCKGDDKKAINEAFISILENNMEKAEYLQENIELYQYFSEDCLEFEGFVCGYDFAVRFTEEGELFFFTAAGVTRYNLTEEDFKSFHSLVQSTVK